MTPQKLITSGTLELYVCGALTVEEHHNVTTIINTSPQVKQEVEQIERAFMELSQNTAPKISSTVWPSILSAISLVIRLQKDSNRNWPAFTGWAAAILCIGGLIYMLNQNADLKEEMKLTIELKNQLEVDLDSANNILLANENILEILRSKEYTTIILPGNQAVAPQAYSKVIYNKKEAVAYIDIKGLPEAPQGKVYQVWSLVLEPLTPSSMGLITNATLFGEGLHKFEDIPKSSQAFGITLEPEGGSETPTLSQLYTLGTVAP